MEKGSRKRSSSARSEKIKRELVTDRKKMEGCCSTGQSPQQAVVPMEEEKKKRKKKEEESYENMYFVVHTFSLATSCHLHPNKIVNVFFFQENTYPIISAVMTKQDSHTHTYTCM
jgi:hypothetical protein